MSTVTKKVYKLGSLDLTTTGNNPIFTTDSDKGDFLITAVRYVTTALSGVTGSLGEIQFNVGYNAPDYTDTLSNATIEGDNDISVSIANNIFNMIIINLGLSSANIPTSVIPVNTDMILSLTTAATNATTCTIDLFIEGHYTNG